MTLAQVPFNEVDNLVLSQLAMIRWEALPIPDEKPRLGALGSSLSAEAFKPGITQKDDRQLLALTAGSPRFGEALVLHYVHELDEEEDKQFSATSFLLPDNTMFVSFRGTDGTLVGWREDFNLSLLQPIPSQLQARNYLAQVMNAYPSLSFRVGGHSKGGNLAMYAAATQTESLQQRLIAVYSNDAPGLSDAVFESQGYQRLLPILHAYVPQSSIIGLLLMHPQDLTIVSSNSVSILQHNPYTWQVERGTFVREQELQASSVYIDRVTRSWLSGLDEAQRKQFINTLFDTLEATEAKSIGKDLWLNALRNPKAIVNAMQGLDAETRQKLAETLSALGNAAARHIRPIPQHKAMKLKGEHHEQQNHQGINQGLWRQAGAEVHRPQPGREHPQNP